MDDIVGEIAEETARGRRRNGTRGEGREDTGFSKDETPEWQGDCGK